MSEPRQGEMVLYDDILPPLVDNSYRMTTSTDVHIAGAAQPLPAKESFFDIEGPRFRLPATDVAGVFPPRNGHGPFHDAIPHIVLGRRTLPWERKLDPHGLIGTPDHDPAHDPPPLSEDGLPWLALLLFEEGEYTLLQNVPLDQVVPRDVFQRMGSPPGVTCDAIEVDERLLEAVMPSKEEVQLLTHVRRVNVEDRELSVGSGDGFFAVVMANRVPSDQTKCRACLVSLEERSDVVPRNPPPVARPFISIIEHARIAGGAPEIGVVEASAIDRFSTIDRLPGVLTGPILYFPKVRLVLLHSWQFETIGDASFRELMQRLDDAMIGTVKDPGHPAVADTGHIRLDLQDRLGEAEKAWYRGPLVPFPLTRDTLGPYHSADQCRRATAETGGEDVSYAAAFEVGRLLAAADPRLAQELMRWRREAFKQSTRTDSVSRVSKDVGLMSKPDLHLPIVQMVAATALEKVAQGAGPIADPYGINKIKGVVGLNPAAVQTAFNLPSQEHAVALLGGDAGALGAAIATPLRTVRQAETIAAVAADVAALDRLGQARDRLIANATAKLGGNP